MDAPYQDRDDTAVMAASSGGDFIRGMMPRKGLEVKGRESGSTLLLAVTRGRSRQEANLNLST